MPKQLWMTLGLCVGGALSAQTTATVPPICEFLPGNAAVSMPLRWSQGFLQVFVDDDLLPSNFVGETITGLRLRRSTLPGDVDYAALTRTLTVRGGFQPYPAAQMVGGRIANRPANMQTLFGPAPVTVAATTAPAAGTSVGQEFVQVTFTQPLQVVAGTLFLEFEASDGPLSIEADNWVDAVWFPDGDDTGYLVPVGDGSCTTRAAPTELRWLDGEPLNGEDIDMQVTGVAPGGLVLAWVGIDPVAAPPGPTYTGWNGTFGPADPAMSECYMWAPFEASWFGVADPAGVFGTTFTMPSAAVGLRLGVQAGWLDLSRPVVPLSFSNGLQIVCNSAGVQNHCSSMFFPGTALSSPWGPYRGQMPVLVLDY